MSPLTSAHAAANSTGLLLCSATPVGTMRHTNLSRTDKTATRDLTVKICTGLNAAAVTLQREYICDFNAKCSRSQTTKSNERLTSGAPCSVHSFMSAQFI